MLALSANAPLPRARHVGRCQAQILTALILGDSAAEAVEINDHETMQWTSKLGARKMRRLTQKELYYMYYDMHILLSQPEHPRSAMPSRSIPTPSPPPNPFRLAFSNQPTPLDS